MIKIKFKVVAVYKRKLMSARLAARIASEMSAEVIASCPSFMRYVPHTLITPPIGGMFVFDSLTQAQEFVGKVFRNRWLPMEIWETFVSAPINAPMPDAGGWSSLNTLGGLRDKWADQDDSNYYADCDVRGASCWGQVILNERIDRFTAKDCRPLF